MTHTVDSAPTGEVPSASATPYFPEPPNLTEFFKAMNTVVDQYFRLNHFHTADEGLAAQARTLLTLTEIKLNTYIGLMQLEVKRLQEAQQ